MVRGRILLVADNRQSSLMSVFETWVNCEALFRYKPCYFFDGKSHAATSYLLDNASETSKT
jgi:hypothetical protein